MNVLLKRFANNYFPDSKNDLFACFIEQAYSLAKGAGRIAMVTMQSWMFLWSFEKMREEMLSKKTIDTMAHLGSRAFGSLSGEVVQATSFVLKNWSISSYKPTFLRLLEGGEETKAATLTNKRMRFDVVVQDDFKRIPGSPLAYWVSERVRQSVRPERARLERERSGADRSGHW